MPLYNPLCNLYFNTMNHRAATNTLLSSGLPVRFAFKNFLFLACLIICLASCQKKVSRETLQPLLENAAKGFHGTVGLYVYYPKTGMEAGFNMDTVFPTASMVKVPILCTLWSRIHAKQLNPDSLIHFYSDSIHYPWKGEDALSRFAPGEDIFVRKLMTHMITFSDNHASLYLQDLAGKGTGINEWLAKEGFKNTRVNSRTPGRETAQQEFGWGQTSPREMANLVLRIRNGEIVSPAASEAIYRHLTRIYWNAEALSQIPPYIQVASKQGAVDESKSEVAMVNAPHGDYLFCIITKNQKDTSWVRNNEGYVLIRKISSLLWNYFEPGNNWKPLAEEEKYLP
jgi:beta-lactamase class A